MENYFENYTKWLASDVLSDGERNELKLISQNENEIKERFSFGLSFGTGGLRGLMKTGMNAMNTHTVGLATQGMANYIIKEGRQKESVVVGFDVRINSRLFAETVASVFAANGIHVFLFDDVRPTPELSFAIRELHCVAGVNITASHNPKEYNGYKAYWDDGAQLSLESADAVYAEMNSLNVLSDVKQIDIKIAIDSKLVTIIGDEIDELYLKNVQKEAVYPDVVHKVADDLKIVYNPLHGCGYKLIPEVLKRQGFKNIYIVPEQSKPNGKFPTVKKPNPEYIDVYDLGIKLANEVGSDIVFATDPDADRFGAVVRNSKGDFSLITGNQMGALLLDYILTAYEETNTMPSKPYAIKTIVSTELFTKVCKAHNISCENCLTGFKFICEVIKRHEQEGQGTYVFGFEESYGYLKGTYARDKDSVVTSVLVCEMAAYYRLRNMTLLDALDALWDRLGYSYESTDEIYISGIEGANRILNIMKSFRNNSPVAIGNVKVSRKGDYLEGKFTNISDGSVTPTNLPKSNVMYFELENGDIIVMRPSGTEPKIKFYYLLTSASKSNAEELCNAYKSSINKYIGL